ncbi:MAG: hypothetical protein ACRD5H_01895 [Nitrososphaerales archaeon]
MSLNWRQFEHGVLRPALPTATEQAIKLVGETIWHESDRLRALGQYPQESRGLIFGPGLGIASIEESTWDWMQQTTQAVNIQGRSYEELAWDLRLNVQACRLRYRLDPQRLPIEDTIKARADYWQLIYYAGIEDKRKLYIDNARLIRWK